VIEEILTGTPIGGAVANRFGMDRLTWVLFPVYARFEKRNVTTTTTPWPFVKVLRGEGNHGLAVWPLFGWRAKEGSYREQFYLWPLIYKDEHALWQPKPDVDFGFLPFYASETSAAATSETYLWPFFGYTDRTAPVHYHETRYFWPFLVQGRGDAIYINRWGPIYTHSIRKGVDKTWILWPLWCHRTWTEAGLNQNRDYPVLTDYRALIGGLIGRTYGLDAQRLQTVFPAAQPLDLGIVAAILAEQQPGPDRPADRRQVP